MPVSTHSRAKAAAYFQACFRKTSEFQHTAARRRLPQHVVYDKHLSGVSTHSRAKAAANFPIMVAYCYLVSTHSRAKAAAFGDDEVVFILGVSTHSRAKAAARSRRLESLVPLFQHTAARRRLHFAPSSRSNLMKFQHTAARRRLQSAVDFCGHKAFCFNTQPREGGCNTSIDNKPIFSVSTHSRAKAAAQSNTFS